jgi:hypothetical protein
VGGSPHARHAVQGAARCFSPAFRMVFTVCSCVASTASKLTGCWRWLWAWALQSSLLPCLRNSSSELFVCDRVHRVSIYQRGEVDFMWWRRDGARAHVGLQIRRWSQRIQTSCGQRGLRFLPRIHLLNPLFLFFTKSTRLALLRLQFVCCHR